MSVNMTGGRDKAVDRQIGIGVSIPPLLLIYCSLLCSFIALAQEPTQLPKVSGFAENRVTASWNGQTATLTPGGAAGPWTLMAVTPRFAVFENFRDKAGPLVFIEADGTSQVFPKLLEPTFSDPAKLYNGRTLKEILDNPVDVLGKEILAQPGDPAYEMVAPLLVPLSNVYTQTYTFLGTRANYDKVPFFYGGRTDNFDPAILAPEIISIRSQHKVWEGLVGGWLPALRFVYPEENGKWTELVAFAPFRMENGNRWAQPVWYRVARIENSELKWVHYVDSYIPFPPRGEPGAAGFYQDFLGLRDGWNRELKSSMTVSLPDRRIENMSRYSLARVLMTRMDLSPVYGVVDQNYGHTQNDGFQDTFNAETLAMLEWGVPRIPGLYIDNYLGQWVRDDGSILYRGPEVGQYGRMLTNLAQYANYTGDYDLLLKYRTRIDGIVKILLSLREKALKLDKSDPRYGLLAGFSEADACLMPHPDRYMVPFYGNSTEAARGFRDIGRAWTKTNVAERKEWGLTLQKAAAALEEDIQTSINRSMDKQAMPPCIPAIAGGQLPDEVVAKVNLPPGMSDRAYSDQLFSGKLTREQVELTKDRTAPEMFSDRSYVEMLFSGNLTHEQVRTILDCRSTHNDMILGMPSTVSRGDGKKLDGYIIYMHAYGLIQHDFIREYLLLLNSIMAHHYTRGSWTATEVREIDPNNTSYPYATPAQVVVPLMTRWMLVFEDPQSGELWLTKGTPRSWLEDGKKISVSAAPTRYGPLTFQIASSLRNKKVEALLDLPAAPMGARIHLRLRAPEGNQMSSVTVDGQAWRDFDPASETIILPAGGSGKKHIVVKYK